MSLTEFTEDAEKINWSAALIRAKRKALSPQRHGGHRENHNFCRRRTRTDADISSVDLTDEILFMPFGQKILPKLMRTRNWVIYDNFESLWEMLWFCLAGVGQTEKVGGCRRVSAAKDLNCEIFGHG